MKQEFFVRSNHRRVRNGFAMVAVLAAFVAIAPGAGAIVTVVLDPGMSFETTAIDTFTTTGDEMVGMEVTATFADSSTETLIWAVTGFEAGGVASADWALSLSGNTFSDSWSLTNSSGQDITNVFIDGMDGDTIFDVIASSTFTDGSALGRPFTEISNTSGVDVLATYSDSVSLTGDAFLGDLFLRLNIEFDGGLSTGSLYSFRSDTDNALFAGDITPTNPVPEPATMLLFGIGLAGLAARRNRRVT